MRKSRLLVNVAVFVGLVCGLFALGGCREESVSLPAGGDIAAAAAASSALDAVAVLREEQHDNYAIYYTADEYQELLREVTGSYSGIGIYVYPDDATGRTMIYGVMKNGPAYQAGLLPGDIFLEVNGEDLRGLSYDAVSEKLTTYPEGTKLKLLMERCADDGTVAEVEIAVRTAKVDIPTMDYKLLEDGIGLIRIESFNMTTGEQFAAAYDDLVGQDMRGLIIDLRNNGGGEVTAALKICDYFVPKGEPLMHIVDSTGVYYYSAAQKAVDMPLVILQNGHSASASEILIGAVHDNGAGTTIGETSYGKGIVQDLVQLPSGAGLRFTSAQYKTSHNNYIHECGIEPDIYYPMPEDADPLAMYSMDTAIDPQLVKACETLRDMMAADTASDEQAQ